MTDCVICLDEIDDEYVMPDHCDCKIRMHYECKRKCLLNHIYCPICRIKIIEHQPVQYEFSQNPIEFLLYNNNIFYFVIYFILSLTVGLFYLILMTTYYFLKMIHTRFNIKQKCLLAYIVIFVIRLLR